MEKTGASNVVQSSHGDKAPGLLMSPLVHARAGLTGPFSVPSPLQTRSHLVPAAVL